MKNLKIKMARMELDMSQEELAKKVGATRQTIGLIEAGRYNPVSYTHLGNGIYILTILWMMKEVF